jgi:hypothetical protein
MLKGANKSYVEVRKIVGLIGYVPNTLYNVFIIIKCIMIPGDHNYGDPAKSQHETPILTVSE